MSVFAYTPVEFVDGTDPAIDAEHLNPGEQAIAASSMRPGGSFYGEVTIYSDFRRCSPIFSEWTYFGGASDTGDYDIRDGTKGFIIPDGFTAAMIILNVDYGTYNGNQSKIEIAHYRGSTETIIDTDGADSEIVNVSLSASISIVVQSGDKIYPYVYGKENQSCSLNMQVILL